MDGIHDLGGMHGFGRIEREADEPVFHARWEGRVLAMHVATPVPVPGGLRNNIEQMEPVRYLASSYYEKWLHARVKGLVEAGVVTEAELETRAAYFRAHPDVEPPRREDPKCVRRTLEELHTSRSSRRESEATPRFGVGEAVRVRNIHPAGHTRLPRYARGKRGVVVRFYGVHEFQDAVPPGAEARPQPLYAVRFDAGEVWGESSEANSAVYLDLWESYLEPVTGGAE